jgi:cell pole-organizing protein PopZ
MSSPALKIEPSPKALEPSMEEILASIRRIIADDDARPTQKPAPAPLPEPVAAPAAQQDDIDSLFDADPPAEPEGVLELTEAMAAPSEPIGNTDLDFIDAELPAEASEDEPPEPDMPSPAYAAAPEPPRYAAPPPPRREDRLLSTATDGAISAAFGSLTHTILSQNARTLDDLVQDMLRPMLKAWLDDNLPTLVERLVRSEIERVSRGGR